LAIPWHEGESELHTAQAGLDRIRGLQELPGSGHVKVMVKPSTRASRPVMPKTAA